MSAAAAETLLSLVLRDDRGGGGPFAAANALLAISIWLLRLGRRRKRQARRVAQALERDLADELAAVGGDSAGRLIVATGRVVVAREAESDAESTNQS